MRRMMVIVVAMWMWNFVSCVDDETLFDETTSRLSSSDGDTDADIGGTDGDSDADSDVSGTDGDSDADSDVSGTDGDSDADSDVCGTDGDCNANVNIV